MPQVRMKIGTLAGALLLGLGSTLHGQQQVQVIVNAVPNPVPAGSCAGIWVEVRDTTGQRTANVDGIQLYPNSYDYSVPNATDFAWRNNDPASGYLCTRPEAGPVNTPVVATIRGTNHTGATLLAIQPAAATQVASASTPGNPAPPAAAYPQPAPTGAVGPGQPYAQPVPVAQAVPTGQPVPIAQPVAGAPSTADAGSPQAYSPQQSGYQPPPQPVQPGQPVQPVQPVQPAPVSAPPQAEKGVGGFFKKIGKHIKQRAGEVTSATAQNLANSATRLADTTLQTGSGLVSGTVAGVSNMAQVTVGGAGKSLLPSALRMDASADNLALALGSGRAVLRELRFDPATGQLTPAALDLARRVAAELKARGGKWVIEAYVDPGPGDQAVSEYRAGIVKAALIHFGASPESLMALGYGPSKLDAQAPADGGTPTAAHVDIAQRAE